MVISKSWVRFKNISTRYYQFLQGLSYPILGKYRWLPLLSKDIRKQTTNFQWPFHDLKYKDRFPAGKFILNASLRLQHVNKPRSCTHALYVRPLTVHCTVTWCVYRCTTQVTTGKQLHPGVASCHLAVHQPGGATLDQCAGRG